MLPGFHAGQMWAAAAWCRWLAAVTAEFVRAGG
jgi:hypothetical protein